MTTPAGLHLTRGTDVRTLASGLAERLAHATVDPFEAPLVLVPGAGMRRWLSQQVARASDLSGEGICAGVRFEPLAALESLLTGRDAADDPWAPQRLVWHVLDLATSAVPGLQPLSRHLDATDQRYANASRIAHLLDRYARLRPELLRSWSDADSVDDLGLGFDSWQAVLWRALHGCVPGPDQVERRALLLDDLAAGRACLDAPAIAVFCPRQLTAPDADLLAALATRARVDVWLAVPGPVASANPLALRLGRRSSETGELLAARAAIITDLPVETRPTTLLGTVQADLALGRAPSAHDMAANDRSLDVHAAHGPDRQAEVLREVIAGLLADDPTLEPRDVVVMCPNPGVLEPHLSAVFSGADATGRGHPGHSFRVQVADRGVAHENQLYALVRDIMQLGSSRATATQLLGLVAQPFVARRFGFTADDTERVAELVQAASVRWGLNDTHRRLFGLDQVRQGTWQVGVQRLLVGEALSGDDLASAGIIAPVDDVESSDIELLGGLAELVSRVSRLTRRPDRATAAEWVAHLRAVSDLLADVPFDESWQLAQLWAVLERLDRRSGDSPASLGAADALALLDAEFDARGGRPAFGNGSLVVCSLTALAQVPHRVVCLVGLDEGSFPRRGLADGDDLLAGAPRLGEPDAGRDDRQAILDAVTAADERLVVVYQGWSSHTREHRPPPAGLVDLLEVGAATTRVAAPGASDHTSGAESLVVNEPLQPFSPAYFTGTPRSFDTAALRGARALVRPRTGPAPSRYAVGRLALASPVTSLELDQVRAFLAHPAHYFFKERAGLSLREDDAFDEGLPLELDALGRWKIGQRVLDGLLRGHAPEAVQHAEWLRGDLPPGNLGRVILDGVTHTAVRVATQAGRRADGPLQANIIDLGLGGLRLTGRVSTRGDVASTIQFSHPSARHLASAWLDALAITAQRGRPVTAELIGGGKRVLLTAPTPDTATHLLRALSELAAEGLTRILPMPPRTAYRWATARARNTDPMADRGFTQQWEYDHDATWDAVLARGQKPWDALITDEEWATGTGETTLLGALAAIVWRPIVRAESS